LIFVRCRQSLVCRSGIFKSINERLIADKREMPEPIENYVPQMFVRRRKRFAVFAWLTIFSVALVWSGLILAAPLANVNALITFAEPIYVFFGYLCHQIPERSFHIHDAPFAVCSRCFGFYFGFLLGLIIYPLFRALDESEPLPRFWLFLAAAPMTIDWSLGFFGIWENTHFSRSVTGGILGLTCAFFIVPALVEMSRFFADRKLKRLSR
jgi:uncharacterized membrane protein